LAKVVGDFALFLIAKGLTCDDVKADGAAIDYPVRTP
jgi:pyruvate carboxylase